MRPDPLSVLQPAGLLLQQLAEDVAHLVKHIHNTRVGQAVDHRRTVSLGRYQQALAQEREMARDGRLRQVEQLGQRRDMQGLIVQRVQNLMRLGSFTDWQM